MNMGISHRVKGVFRAASLAIRSEASAYGLSATRAVIRGSYAAAKIDVAAPMENPINPMRPGSMPRSTR